MSETEILTLDHQGRGIAKIEGKIVFVPNTIPGEIVKIRITKEKKKFLEGEVVSFIKKDKHRIEDLCPYYPLCGGCQLLHIPYEEQLKYKETKVRNILKKANLEQVSLRRIVRGETSFHYRNKGTFHVQGGKIGYFQDNTNSLIPIKQCLLLDDKINDIIESLPLNQPEMVVRSNHSKATYTNGEKLIHEIGAFHFSVSLNSFFQINDSVTALLYNKVLEYLEPKPDDIVLDLYCGTGTIGIFISPYVNKVYGIEISQETVDNANENKELNKVINIEFFCGDAYKKTRPLHLSPTCVIVDPPRNGLDKDTVNMLLDLSPDRVIYVSCDPMTLTRDLNLLHKKYDINEITPFDMFPNTYHIETVTKLTLRK